MYSSLLNKYNASHLRDFAILTLNALLLGVVNNARTIL